MPQAGQIIPDHLYPHNKVVVNDNTEYTVELPEESDDSIKMLFVLASPKGIDGKLNTIEGGLKEFVSLYGQGPFSLYGQPYLNAYNAFKTGNIVGHVLRVSAENATYSYISIDAYYKIDETGKMMVKFKKSENMKPLTDIEDLTYDEVSSGTMLLADIGEGEVGFPEGDTEPVTPPPTTDGDNTETTNPDDGFTKVPLITVAALGRGGYGRKLRFAVSSNMGSDKENDYKNYIFYVFEVEGTLKQVE